MKIKQVIREIYIIQGRHKLSVEAEWFIMGNYKNKSWNDYKIKKHKVHRSAELICAFDSRIEFWSGEVFSSDV